MTQSKIVKVLAGIGGVVFLLLSTAMPSSASAYQESWGPSGSTIFEFVAGQGRFVDYINVGQFSKPGVVCNFKFAATTSVGTFYSGQFNGCSNNAKATFNVRRYLQNGSQVCGWLFMNGNWTRGPCATIRG